MVIEVRGYECEVCGVLMVDPENKTKGKLQEIAQAHEQIPKDEPLPDGLVCLLKNTLYEYAIISSPEFRMRNKERISEDFLNERFHDHAYTELRVYSDGERLRFLRNSYRKLSSKDFRKRLNEGEYKLLTDDELRRFVELKKATFESSYLFGIELSQFTNRIEIPNPVAQ